MKVNVKYKLVKSRNYDFKVLKARIIFKQKNTSVIYPVDNYHVNYPFERYNNLNTLEEEIVEIVNHLHSLNPEFEIKGFGKVYKLFALDLLSLLDKKICGLLDHSLQRSMFYIDYIQHINYLKKPNDLGMPNFTQNKILVFQKMIAAQQADSVSDISENMDGCQSLVAIYAKIILDSWFHSADRTKISVFDYILNPECIIPDVENIDFKSYGDKYPLLYDLISQDEIFSYLSLNKENLQLFLNQVEMIPEVIIAKEKLKMV